MTTYDRIKELCDKRGIAVTALEKELEFGRGSIGKIRRSSPSTVRLQKIADYFEVTVDYLLGTEETAPTPGLTAKDERDIAKKLQSTLDDLENGADGLMFDGEPLDDETRVLLRDSLQNQLQMTKLLAKQKFTPKKYRQ